MFKKIISSILAVAMLASLGTTVFASNTEQEVVQISIASQVQPRINQSFDFEVTSSEWVPMTFDLNLLNQKLVVSGSNFQNTLKAVQFRIVYSTGIASLAQTLTAGKSVTFNNLPLIGWTLQVRASSGSGWGHFTIQD